MCTYHGTRDDTCQTPNPSAKLPRSCPENTNPKTRTPKVSVIATIHRDEDKDHSIKGTRQNRRWVGWADGPTREG